MQAKKLCPNEGLYFLIEDYLVLTEDDRIIIECPFCGEDHKIPNYDYEYWRPQLEAVRELSRSQRSLLKVNKDA